MSTETEPKQKPNKLAWLTDNLWVFGVVVIVVAVAGHTIIGMRHVQRISDGEALAFETSEATRYLNKLDNAQRRQARTNENEIRLKELQAEFPKKLSGPSTVTRIIQLAERVNMRVTDITTQPGSGNEVGTHIYDTLSIEAHLEGDVNSLREFLAELEDGYIDASRLDRLDIRDIASTSESTTNSQTSPTGQADDSLDVTLLLSVFARVEAIEED
ncbi:MAG: hypothetical protein IH861_04390 [Chloroflexi bacterium]|nr:hypothetical protein [Chloroflexota bacterium]